MMLTKKQKDTKEKIEKAAALIGIDTAWAVAVAFVESSLGVNQKSPTGCKGVFQMSSIAMKDLLQEMSLTRSEWGDIFCGVAFLELLLFRHGTIEAATAKFCNPKDRSFYVERVLKYMKGLG